MFSKPGRAKIRTNPSEIENRAKIRHKSVMLSALQNVFTTFFTNYSNSLDSFRNCLKSLYVPVMNNCIVLYRPEIQRHVLLNIGHQD